MKGRRIVVKNVFHCICVPHIFTSPNLALLAKSLDTPALNLICISVDVALGQIMNMAWKAVWRQCTTLIKGDRWSYCVTALVCFKSSWTRNIYMKINLHYPSSRSLTWVWLWSATSILLSVWQPPPDDLVDILFEAYWGFEVHLLLLILGWRSFLSFYVLYDYVHEQPSLKSINNGWR